MAAGRRRHAGLDPPYENTDLGFHKTGRAATTRVLTRPTKTPTWDSAKPAGYCHPAGLDPPYENHNP